jgi:hypothetical protein
MANVFEIPLSGTPQQFMMQFGDTTYQFVFIYRNASVAGGAGWVVNINDNLGNPVVCGIPLVTGADLLAQYGYLAFNGAMVVLSDGVPQAVPTFDNLGTDSHVYWIIP